MERKSVYVIMALVGMATAACVVFFVFYSEDFVLRLMRFYVLLYVPAIALMAICFLPRIRMGVAPGTPSEVKSTMSLNFRTAQYRVTDKGDSFVVQNRADHGIRIFLTKKGPNSVVLVKSDPTPLGWCALLILFVFTYSIGAIPYTLYLFFKSQRFGLSVIPTMYKHPGETILPGTPSKTKVCLIDTLSEGYRLSSEAYESAKSNYEDNMIVAAVLGMTGFAFVFLTLLVVWVGVTGGNLRVETSLVAGFATGIGLSLAYYGIVRSRSKAELQSLREWSTRMSEELASEVSLTDKGDRNKSTFEVILEASREMPKWLGIRRKSGLFRHPVLWTAILILVMMGFNYLIAAFVGSWPDLEFRVVLAAFSICTLALGIWLYVYVRRKEAEESRQITEVWRQRTTAIERKMEEMLRNL